MRIFLIAMTGLGVALLVGGLLSFVFGGWVQEGTLVVSGFGRFSGFWSSADYCFLGSAMAAVGAGLGVSGYLGLTHGRRA